MTLVRGDRDLTTFRNHWTGMQILDLLAESGGKLRIDWQVGVGKSCNIDQVIEHAIVELCYDLIIALFPTRQLINERRWIKTPPKGVNVTNIIPRPADRCGKSFNKVWKVIQ